jgi:glutamate racemase
MPNQPGPIGVFDSGYGGLTVFKEIVKQLPQYDYIYLGDNARVPYGTRSFDTVYHYTWECVQKLFEMNCSLVILACNTASAKALRTIQQHDLIQRKDYKRVLGVSYTIEIQKFFPEVTVFQEACPMWVPLVENNEHNSDGANYFIQKHVNQLLQQSPQIDTVLLACTHYPLLLPKLKQFLPAHINIIQQGEIVAGSLVNYLQRHPEMNQFCTKNNTRVFYTTESTDGFNEKASLFFDASIQSKHLNL